MNRPAFQMIEDLRFRIEGNRKPVGRTTLRSLHRVIANEPLGHVVHLFCQAHEMGEGEKGQGAGLPVLHLYADKGAAFLVCVGPKFDVAVGRYLDLAHGQSLAWFSSPWSPSRRLPSTTQEAQDRAA